MAGRYFYPVLFFLLLALFFGHYAVSGQAVYGDGIGYYAHLHTWVIDGDFDFTSEYTHLYNPLNNNAVAPVQVDDVQIVATRPDGTAENHYSPGPAVLLLPWYALAHGLALLLAQWWPVSTTGYGDIYQIFSGVGAVAYVIAGLWLLERFLLQLPDSKTSHARIAAAAVLLASPLLYYGGYDVVNSHFASFFLTSAFFYCAFHPRQTRLLAVNTGLLAGLLAATRIQDGAVVPVWLFIEWQRSGIRTLLRRTAYFLGGVLVGMAPLAIHTATMFSSIWEQTYLRNLAAERSAKTPIDFWGSIFHPTTGLLRTPLLLTVLASLPVLPWRAYQRWLLPLGTFFLLQAAIITIQGGWQAAAYGGRMYISSLPFFALVLVLLAKWLSQRTLGWVLPLALLVFSALNVISMGIFVVYDR
jgi:hypothetical protein